MTSNTSPKKPDWFALIEKDAPSAQVRKIDKKLPAATGFIAITIVALGAFFTNGSLTLDSSAASTSNGGSLSTVASNHVAGTVNKAPVTRAQSINKIADPTLNGGGDEDEDEHEEESEDSEDDRD